MLNRRVRSEVGGVLALLVSLAVPGGLRAGEGGSPETTSDARAAIAEASRRFSAAFVAGDADGVGAVYTEDAVLLPPGRNVRGRAAIRQYFSPRPGRKQISHAMTTEDLRVDGDLAVDAGTWTNTVRVGDAEPRTDSERYLVVWRRGKDGQWRIEWDMWHRPAPGPSVTPTPQAASLPPPATEGAAGVPASAPLQPELGPLRPFVGRTWKGLVNAEKKLFDVARWEAALGGRVVRILHSVGDGAYGGETVVRWDATAKEMVYDYYTTAGFATRGTMSVDARGRLESRELVRGDAGGVREVRATQELLPDGAG